jgi:hypothetical protein
MAIEDFENKYAGSRVFLVGNGPSLLDTPLEQLSSEYTIAMTGIHNIYSETNWRPSFYMFLKSSFNKVDLESVMANVELDIPCFIKSSHDYYFPDQTNIHYLDTIPLKTEEPEANLDFHEMSVDEVSNADIEMLSEIWSTDLTEDIYRYHAMYPALQLAQYMGFDPIYLVGCDLGFRYHDPHIVFDSGLDPHHFSGGITEYATAAKDEDVLLRSLANAVTYKTLQKFLILNNTRLLTKFSKFADPNHFDDDYIPIPEDKRYVNEELTKSHILARRMLSQEGTQVFNATVGGELETYERVDIEELLD